jgi:hypothetical protein
LKNGFLIGFDPNTLDVYSSCLLGKMHKLPFRKGKFVTGLLGLIHSELCGPMSTQDCGGYEYFVTFTDVASRFGYMFLVKHKSEILKSSKNLDLK